MKQEIMQDNLKLAQTKLQRKFWEKIQPVDRVATSDTYKRTMSGSSNLFANNFASYSLCARRALQEPRVNGRYIMAGIERMLYPWFMNPISDEEINDTKEFFSTKSQVKKFPTKAWEKVKENNGFLPLDVYGLKGGQTFLVIDGKYVPMLTVEGPGSLVSHIEPHLENNYTGIIHATKAKLFQEVTNKQFAEFGLRADELTNNHILLMLDLYIGGGIELTSDDQAVRIFPEYFKDIGTIGHEFITAYQKSGRTLEEAQRLAFKDFVSANDRSALLPDVINTIESGLPAILNFVKEYQNTNKIIMPRFDSGNIIDQCIYWKKMTLNAGILDTKMVVEDGYTPGKARETKEAYENAGFNPDDIITGAGGYFHIGCQRDAASLVYKRGSTIHDGKLESQLKFSDSPGKGSIPGSPRAYAQGRTLVVAQHDEPIDGELLTTKLVENGKILYNEDLHTQHERSNKTWNLYDKVEYSPKTLEIIDQRLQERDKILEKYKLEAIEK